MKTVLQLKGLELSLGTEHIEWDSLTQCAPAMFEVEAEYAPEQRAITNRDPDDCQPGWPASWKIHSVKPVDDCPFAGEVSTATIKAKAELVERLTPSQIGKLEDELLTDMARCERDYEREAA
jgi:hypothetical protein